MPSSVIQLSLFPSSTKATAQPQIASTPELDALLRTDPVVTFNLSGGKDSSVLAVKGCAYLDAIGYQGPRIAVHADLGAIEWNESLPMCQTIAERCGLELVVVRHRQGGLIERWERRWLANVRRYARLACVKLVLPWSTASMRFCTSELKIAVITSYLVRRYAGQTIISANGIRADESASRAAAPIWKPQKRLLRSTLGTNGFDWHPILHYTLNDVWRVHEEHALPRHPAYTVWGASRCSCRYCILGAGRDLAAAAADERSHAVYRRLVALEIRSTFSFQSQRWLGDVAPHVLSDTQRTGLAEAKARATKREAAERGIPKHLLYTKDGWPQAIPTLEEAQLLAKARQAVADAVGIPIMYTDPQSIQKRYEELLDLRAAKHALQAERAARRVARGNERTKRALKRSA